MRTVRRNPRTGRHEATLQARVMCFLVGHRWGPEHEDGPWVGAKKVAAYRECERCNAKSVRWAPDEKGDR